MFAKVANFNIIKSLLMLKYVISVTQISVPFLVHIAENFTMSIYQWNACQCDFNDYASLNMMHLRKKYDAPFICRNSTLFVCFETEANQYKIRSYLRYSMRQQLLCPPFFIELVSAFERKLIIKLMNPSYWSVFYQWYLLQIPWP